MPVGRREKGWSLRPMKSEVFEKASTIFADLDSGGGCFVELFGKGNYS